MKVKQTIKSIDFNPTKVIQELLFISLLQQITIYYHHDEIESRNSKIKQIADIKIGDKDSIRFLQPHCIYAIDPRFKDYYHLQYMRYQIKEDEDFYKVLLPYLRILKDHSLLKYVESDYYTFDLVKVIDDEYDIEMYHNHYVDETKIYFIDVDMKKEISKVLTYAYTKHYLNQDEYEQLLQIHQVKASDEIIYDDLNVQFVFDKDVETIQLKNHIEEMVKEEYEKWINLYIDKDIEVAKATIKHHYDQNFEIKVNEVSFVDVKKDYCYQYYYRIINQDCSRRYCTQAYLYEHPLIEQMIQQHLVKNPYIYLYSVCDITHDELSKLLGVYHEDAFRLLHRESMKKVKTLNETLLQIQEALKNIYLYYPSHECKVMMFLDQSFLPIPCQKMLLRLGYHDIDEVLDESYELLMNKIKDYKKQVALTLLDQILIDLGIDACIKLEMKTRRLMVLDRNIYDYMIQNQLKTTDEIFRINQGRNDLDYWLDTFMMKQWLDLEAIVEKKDCENIFVNGLKVIPKSLLNQKVLKTVNVDITMSQIKKVYMFDTIEHEMKQFHFLLVADDYYLLSFHNHKLRSIRRSSSLLKKMVDEIDESYFMVKNKEDYKLLYDYCKVYQDYGIKMKRYLEIYANKMDG